MGATPGSAHLHLMRQFQNDDTSVVHMETTTTPPHPHARDHMAQHQQWHQPQRPQPQQQQQHWQQMQQHWDQHSQQQQQQQQQQQRGSEPNAPTFCFPEAGRDQYPQPPVPFAMPPLAQQQQQQQPHPGHMAPLRFSPGSREIAAPTTAPAASERRQQRQPQRRPQRQQQPKATNYDAEIGHLVSMGFDPHLHNLAERLARHKGNLSAVVDDLLSSD